jgi:predicted RNA-binding Zn ribbon-like protein
METLSRVATLPAHIRELPIVAGDLALDFANTVDDPGGRLEFDHIADYGSLLTWAERVGIASGSSADALYLQAEANNAAASAVVTDAAVLRSALNELFGALVDDRSPTAGWDRLRPFVAAAVEHAELSTTIPPTAVWDLAELGSPLWPVADAAHQLVTSSAVSRLKRCGNCPWLFLDQSKNGSRRWCSMEICGTHQKIRRYVTKRAASRAVR